MNKYKIIMTGGGTAGHVTPNLALVPKLKAKGFEIKYIGSKDGIEKEIINDATNPPFEKITFGFSLFNILFASITPFITLKGSVKFFISKYLLSFPDDISK